MGPALRPARRARRRPGTGRGFQPVERSIASSAERGAARLTTKRLDAPSMPMPAIADQRMDESVSVAKVLALRVRTSEPFGRYADGALPGGFSPRSMAAPAEAPGLCTRRGSGGETTGRTNVWAVLQLEMVDKSTSPLQTHFGR